MVVESIKQIAFCHTNPLTNYSSAAVQNQPFTK